MGFKISQDSRDALNQDTIDVYQIWFRYNDGTPDEYIDVFMDEQRSRAEATIYINNIREDMLYDMRYNINTSSIVSEVYIKKIIFRLESSAITKVCPVSEPSKEEFLDDLDKRPKRNGDFMISPNTLGPHETGESEPIPTKFVWKDGSWIKDK